MKFTVNHEPIGQPRHRVSTRGGHARLYLPSRHPVHSFKRAIRLAFGAKRVSVGPVGISITCYFPRPKSKVWKTKEMEEYWHTGKPDFDNVAKAVCDALTGWAWEDDTQICYAIIRKKVVGVTAPRVQIEIDGMSN